MPETLAIRLPEDLDAPVRWTIIDEAGTRIGGVNEGSLSTAAEAAEQRDVMVLVPGTQVIRTRAQLPVKSVSKMLQVVPFALEEQIAGDVTRLHFAIGERDDDGNIEVMAVRKDRMTGWVDALDDAGLSTARMVPDSVGMPTTENGFTVLLDEAEACIYDPDGVACYVDHVSLADALDLMTSAPPVSDEDDTASETTEEQAPHPVVVFFEDTEPFEALLETIKTAVPHAEFRRLPAGSLARLAAEALERNPATLRQGDFAPKGRIDKLWRPWRTAAMLAAVALFGTVTLKAVELVTYKNRLAAVRTEINTLYQSVPGARANEIDPVGAIRRRLGGGGTATASDFLDGLSVLAGALKSDKTYVEAISYSNGTMSLEVMAPDVPTLDALRVAINSAEGWQARLTRTRDEDAQVEGRMQLERTGQ